MTQYDNDNIFAQILRGEMPATKIYEDEETLAFMDIMPRSEGHSLVIPKAPMRNLLDAQDDALAAVAKTAKKIANASMDAFDADGITIQQFNEDAGGQVVFHYHVHVIPRFKDKPMSPPGQMGDPEVIKQNAEKIIKNLKGD